MKIWEVGFNDGGYHERRPSYQVVANSKEEAIEKVLVDRSYYRSGYDISCWEFKIDGYVIEVYDAVSYERDKKLEKVLGNQ